MDENTKIIVWRQGILEDAGYDTNQASIISNRLDVDLHTACDLLTAGCPPDQAVLILT